MFENRVLRRISGPKREEVAEAGEDFIAGVASLIISIVFTVLVYVRFVAGERLTDRMLWCFAR
jgi:hypothetical protein